MFGREREPVCSGIKAIWSPHTGIVDWSEVGPLGYTCN